MIRFIAHCVLVIFTVILVKLSFFFLTTILYLCQGQREECWSQAQLHVHTCPGNLCEHTLLKGTSVLVAEHPLLAEHLPCLYTSGHELRYPAKPPIDCCCHIYRMSHEYQLSKKSSCWF